jgi:photosystem I P700 chlorophyll a apoprotein A1
MLMLQGFHITGGNLLKVQILSTVGYRFLWAHCHKLFNHTVLFISVWFNFLGAHFYQVSVLCFIQWSWLLARINQLFGAQQVKSSPAIQPQALSITLSVVGVAHYPLGGIATTWAFF